ncbi:MAG: ABC transporter substrate-binding protein, partial [Chloroflexi bacterium]|nr:ABC transporter substrate-binding protein [Chloroflexota bacterium]
ALALDLFKKEGVAVEPRTAPSVKDVKDIMRKGEADVALGGPIRSYQLAAGDDGDRLICFAEVVQRNIFFLVGRRPEPAFTLRHLAGKTYLGVTEVITSWVMVRWLLQQDGIDPSAFERVDGLSLAEQVAAYRSGKGDYVDLPQPLVEPLLEDGSGHIVYSFGDAVGPISWSGYLTLPSTLHARSDELVAVVRAVGQAERWLADHTGAEVAELVGHFYPDIPRPTLAAIVDRYRRHDTWPEDPRPRREHWEHMHAILRAAGFIDRDVPLDQVVTMDLARRAGY